MTTTLSPRLLGYLTSWHATSTRKQAASGNVVDLSFDAFLGLFEKRQLRSLERAIVEGRLPAQQHETNPYALVLSWRSYSACSLGQFNAQTACVCSRAKSAKINLPQKGDKLRPGHAASIAKALIGVPKSEYHRKAISEGCKGVSKAAWTPERKAARRALLAERKEA
ncbi:hypothetical protein [Sphingomonas aerolata]|uniref:hypothetical protein n=1 Tax=Sphingomonas aerolata TaxID=185951 RepID=UPI003360BBB0